MSLNTAHANNGVLIHSGETILLFSENVTIEFSGQDDPVFKGTKQGSIYLTTHRMIFNSKKFEDVMKSFSFPFICLNEVQVEQPMFGANYIRGKVRAQVDGNFVGEAKFKLIFKTGGAIEFAQAMLRAAHMAQQNANGMQPPPYTPPGEWHPAPPPAYTLTPGQYGWLPTGVFPNGPNPNQVYMHDSPPPYPGIVPNNYPQPGYQQPGNQQPGNQQPGYQQPGYQQPGYQQPGYQHPGYQQPGYQHPGYQQPGYQQPGFQQPGYPQPGYPQPGYQQPGFQPQSAYPGGYPAPPYSNPAPSYPQSGFQQPPYPGYPPQNGGAGGFSHPNSKEAEAMQSSNNPVQPNNPYAPPPPGYNEPPPSYSSLNAKKDL